MECSGNVGWTVFVRQRKGLLFAQTELARLFVIGDVATRGLGSEPFAHITLVGFGFCCEFGRGERSFRERFVQTKLFTNHDHTGVDGGSEIPYELTDEGV